MIAIIKYNAGNTSSVKNALARLGYDSVITDDAEIIKSADKVILPGVGEANSAMKYIQSKQLDEVIRSITQPFLGVCLGLQLMCKHSEEGDTDCLNIFDTEVKLFPAEDIIPHMGWNNFEQIEGVLFNNIKISDNVYYVHRYYAEPCKHTVATCNYIRPFSTSMQKVNFYATQFHPEKSAGVGEQILKNFLEL